MQASREKIYVFDSSAFIALHRHNTQVIELPNEVWGHLTNMIEGGTIISHRYVYEEIVIEKSKKPDLITQWLIPKKKYFTPDNMEQLRIVSDIIAKFPRLIRADREKDQADPWVIALAELRIQQGSLLEKPEYTVVTQENPNKSMCMPAVCRHRGINSMNLKEFFIREGVELQKK